ncbi:MAG: response regulator [Bacteroidales bacterium]|nr:response regulator [Bacteroidales bacterium]MBN2756662.1 response regulator [Bacteroidales bacterium]
MNFINNLSIRIKIIILIVVISTINIVFASFSYFSYDKKDYYKEIIDKLNILSDIIGESNSATMLFKDYKIANEYISSLKVDKNILQANIFLSDSTKLANYTSKFKSLKTEKKYDFSIKKDTIIFYDDIITINKPIEFDFDYIGTVRIEYSLAGYDEKVNRYIRIIFIILSISIIAATILAFIFQKIITKPIFGLYNTMNKISRKKDYSIRSKNTTKDEIGKLSDGFNTMIHQIEKQNNELNTAKENAVSSLKAKERFLANMTHELRTPLNSIIGLSSLIEETSLNNEQKNYLSNIKSSSSHLLSIINDLLEFSKLGSGKLNFEKREFTIRSTIDRIKDSMKFELDKRNLEFKTAIDDSVPHLLIGDEYRLNQVLINLIGNAIKFTPKGSITLTIKVLFETESKSNLEFKVIDTGIGIKPDRQKIIFDSFTQESFGTSREYGGTGLGLSITKELIELQGGEIRVESEKNKGSSFIFIIPFQKKLITDSFVNYKKNYAPENIKILVVDDNEMNLLFTKSLLIKRNFMVETSNNGIEALEKINTGNFNLLLLDLYMPEMDGYQISKKIRSLDNENLKNIPIIAITAAATISEIKKCFKFGMNDYLTKPVDNEVLISKILAILHIKE